MTLTLDRTPLDESEILLTGLPIPPSVNHAFVNVGGKGRVRSKSYSRWAEQCGWLIRAQRQRPVKGRVGLTYTIQDGGTKADLGNLEKATTDLLVSLSLIEDDGPKFVRSIKLQWGAVDGLQIEVRAAA